MSLATPHFLQLHVSLPVGFRSQGGLKAHLLWLRCRRYPAEVVGFAPTTSAPSHYAGGSQQMNPQPLHSVTWLQVHCTQFVAA